MLPTMRINKTVEFIPIVSLIPNIQIYPFPTPSIRSEPRRTRPPTPLDMFRTLTDSFQTPNRSFLIARRG